MNNSKAKWLIFVLLVGAWSSSNLTCHSSEKKPDMSLTKVIVDSVKVADLQPQNGEAELMVHGISPNPAYTIDHIDVKVTDEEIRVTPWAKHDPHKIVIMVTVPFAEKCRVTKLVRDRNYSIRVEGVNKVVVQRMTVK